MAEKGGEEKNASSGSREADPYGVRVAKFPVTKDELNRLTMHQTVIASQVQSFAGAASNAEAGKRYLIFHRV